MSARAISAGGFTLVELLVVLAIAGLIVGLARPMYSAVVPGAKTQADARALVGVLRDSANRAVSAGRDVAVVFATDSARYAVADGDPIELARNSRLTVETTLARGATENGRGEPVAELRFYPDGSSSGAAITLQGETRSFRIGVDWLTGSVSIREDDDDSR